MYKRTCTRAAGVSPPWHGNAIAAVFVHRPPTGRLCATIAIQPLRSRFQNHGGLTPAALVSGCERLPAKNDFCDAQAHVHKSGGRQPAVGSIAPRGQCTASNVRRVTTIQSRSSGCQPAVVRIRACNGDRFLRTDSVSPRAVASRTTAGSRQPLLGGRRAFGVKCAISAADAHAHKSGGRQLAVVCDTNVVR
jgi:hypothetical protein